MPEKQKQPKLAHPAAPEPAGTPAAPSIDPIVRLQQHAGNQAISSFLQSGAGGPLAITENGRTTFDSQAPAHPRFPEIAAHEAVHRAQFQASDKPAGSVPQLERDATAGSRALLAGIPYAPAFRASPGQALGWPPGAPSGTEEGLSSEAQSLERLGAGASKTGSVAGSVVREGAPGERQTTRFHLEVAGQGQRGSVTTSTDLVLSVDPGDPSALIGAGSKETNIPASQDPRRVYPVVIQYSRTISLTDAAGRDCKVEISGAAYLSHESFDKATQFRLPAFDTLIHLRGDRAILRVKLQGSAPVQNYRALADASGNESLSTLSEGLARSLGTPGTGIGVVSKEQARFVEPELSAGEQFESLEAFLVSADNEEIGRRVMADLDKLAGGAVLPRGTKLQPGKPEEETGGLLGLLESALIAAAVALAVVAAIFLVAEVFAVSLAVAAAAVIGTLMATAFLNALQSRYKEAEAAGDVNPVAILSAAILDTVGVSKVQEAITDESILTGQKLNRSFQERLGSGITGVVEVFMNAIGIREVVKGGLPGRPGVPSAPPSGEAAPAPEGPAVTPEPQVQPPAPPPVTEPPGTLKPATPVEPGRAPTVFRRRPSGAHRQQPYPVQAEEPDIGDVLSGRRMHEEEVPHAQEEIESGFQNVEAPDRFHWSMTEEDLVEFGVRRFKDLPGKGWERQPRYANGQRVSGRFPRRDPAQPNRPAYTQPEWFHPAGSGRPPISLEGKNWKIGQELDEFVTKTANQARARQSHLPSDTQQYVIIDIRGQEVSEAVQKQIIDRLVKESNGTLQADRIHFLTSE